VTTLAPSYDRSSLEGLRVVSKAAARHPRYENRYDAAGARTQLLRCEGEPLRFAAGDVPAPVDVLIVAPAYHELAAPPACDARVVAVLLQGLLRTRAADGRVSPHPEAWAQVAPFARPGAFAFLSDEDTAAPGELAATLASAGVRAFVTHGARGATLFEPDGTRAFAALTADVVEPTGAGDCFATAFIVRFAETGDIGEAVQFALAAGALAVEARGLAAIPSRAAIEARLRKVAA
jgi:sugar/nucleoside kinase (ribokinase family)